MMMPDGDHLRRIEEALMRYAQEMHEYTLQLWADSRRVSEEKKAAKAAESAKKRAERVGAKAAADAKKVEGEKEKDRDKKEAGGGEETKKRDEVQNIEERDVKSDKEKAGGEDASKAEDNATKGPDAVAEQKNTDADLTPKPD